MKKVTKKIMVGLLIVSCTTSYSWAMQVVIDPFSNVILPALRRHSLNLEEQIEDKDIQRELSHAGLSKAEIARDQELKLSIGRMKTSLEALNKLIDKGEALNSQRLDLEIKIRAQARQLKDFGPDDPLSPDDMREKFALPGKLWVNLMKLKKIERELRMLFFTWLAVTVNSVQAAAEYDIDL